MVRVQHRSGRRAFLVEAVAGVLGAAAAASTGFARAAHAAGGAKPIDLEEVTVDELQQRMSAGALTSKALVAAYLERIAALNERGPRLGAVLETNPDALAIAASLDGERRAGRVRGPLHGIPVLVKDNIDTADRMKTTAGSLALLDAPAPRRDAFVVERLRAAGAVILGKSNLSEWANMRGGPSVSGWSARGGHTRNPYALDRTACGSSSGSGAGVAANLAMLAIGTETWGSIQCPSAMNGVVGIKPTVGLLSRGGIIPVSLTMDTPGPMARTVRDAVYLLAAMAASDPADAATTSLSPRPGIDPSILDAPSPLRGARIGICTYLWGSHRDALALMRANVEALQRQGAEVVEIELDDGGVYVPYIMEVMLTDLRVDMAKYLEARGAKQKTLEDLIAFNRERAAQELALFGQERFEAALQTPEPASTQYRVSRQRITIARREIAGLFEAHKLDAIFEPTAGIPWLTDLVRGDTFDAVGSATPTLAQGPVVTVPGGFVQGLPWGVSFEGRVGDDVRVIQLAHAFEQATKHRRPPAFKPSAG